MITNPKPRDVRGLDLLSYSEKVRHWDRDDDPWRPEEGSYRFKNPDPNSLRLSTEEGHVRRIRLLVGRPCFGIPTAFLRYRYAMRPVKNRGLVPASRCHGCKLAERCKRLVDRRLTANEAIRQAHIEWLLAGGPAGFMEPNWREEKVGRRWKDLVRALIDHPFENANDEQLAIHYAALDAQAREKDRVRKAHARVKKLKAGEPDHRHIHDVQKAANKRLERVVIAVKNARETKGPKALRQLSRDALMDLRNVWMGRQLLLLQQRKPRAAEIARWIVDCGMRNESVNLNALATRVRKDLRRIEDLERFEVGGERLIPPFDVRLELS